jgi:long-chain acyl-CoA synthetase
LSDTRTAEEILAAYETAVSRPWAKLYPPGFEEPDPRGQTALDLFRAVPRDAIAIVYFDATLSYGEIDIASERLAAWLQTRKVGRGDRLALILQNTPQFVVAAVAAWKLGAIVVSLNPMYRAPELAKLFADCTPKAAICHDDQWRLVAEAGDGVISPGLILWASARDMQSRNDTRVLPEPTEAPLECALSIVLEDSASPGAPSPLTPEDIGLLLYTSGTTGAPKGAMLTHRNLVANAHVAQRVFGLTGSSRIFDVAPLFHVTGFELQLVCAFAAGASQVLTYRFQAGVVLDAFLEWRPTFIIGAITAFIALMNHPQATAEHFASFAHIYSGGAPIAPAVVSDFAKRFGRQIRSSYGMTELTAPSHLAPPEGEIPVDPVSGAFSIGIPNPGVDVLIVDDQRRPLVAGQHGEVVVRGSGVMAGYWNKPTETAETLVGGWMHTGDIGFVDKDGWFYLVDRKKDMISASGFKVWPREVEDVLYAFPGVREAAVVGAPDPYRGETVVAFVSSQPGAALDVAALAAFCRERLAAYKQPTKIHVMDDLPKTATGKITRNTLKQDARSV